MRKDLKMGKINKRGAELISVLESEPGARVKRCMCKCPLCGNIYETWTSHFYRGSNPCECLKYRKNNPRLYRIYTNMKTRCYNEINHNYPRYGGRGITICDEWKKDFKAFLSWALENGYSENLTIDRIDVNGNYEPNNCRWSNAIEQANNKRNTVFVEGMSLRRYCKINHLNYKTAHGYISRNGIEKWRDKIRHESM